MRRSRTFVGLSGLGLILTTSMGCVSVTGTVTVRRSTNTPPVIEIPSSDEASRQQLVSLYFSTLVNQRLWLAAQYRLWPEEATDWVETPPPIECPLPPGASISGGTAAVRCPCPPLCCCPDDGMLGILIDMLRRPPPAELDATVSPGGPDPLP